MIKFVIPAALMTESPSFKPVKLNSSAVVSESVKRSRRLWGDVKGIAVEFGMPSNGPVTDVFAGRLMP